MNSRARALVDNAEGEVGYLEKASNSQLGDKTANAGTANWTKYGAWYGGGLNGYAWCAMFVSWCADKAGIPTDTIPKFHSCTSGGVAFFKQSGRWHLRDEYTPETGDIIFFTSDNGKTAAHVGIVRDVDSARVYTIEGNTSGGSTLIANGGGVAEKSYALDYWGIYGYGHPNYEEDLDMDIEALRRELTTVAETGSDHSDWADDAVGTFVDAGIFNGDGSGNYGWGQCLTREGAAKVLFNLLDRLDLLDKL